jgi:hypothetical protein
VVHTKSPSRDGPGSAPASFTAPADVLAGIVTVTAVVKQDSEAETVSANKI